MTCKDPDLEQVEHVTEVGSEVEVVNKLAIEGGGEGENRGCQKGGPTKLPAKGGGHQQRPGKEEPFVGWRKEGTTDLKPLAKQVGGEEELKTNPFTLASMVVEWRLWGDLLRSVPFRTV